MRPLEPSSMTLSFCNSSRSAAAKGPPKSTDVTHTGGQSGISLPAAAPAHMLISTVICVDALDLQTCPSPAEIPVVQSTHVKLC